MKTSRILLHILLATSIISSFSCANRSMGPQGGPKDITAPKFVSAQPASGSLKIHNKEIEILFDEFVSLDKPLEKIIVSPPQQTAPDIHTNGKKVLISFKDSLIPNTTYSIDFTSSIKDINEGNTYDGFTYSFSTGKDIDTLEIAGTVLDAANLNPLPNYVVSIYDNLNDSAFTHQKPLRIGKTDEKGHFRIRNIKPGKYHLFALNDLNHDFFYNDPNEQLAFLDNIISPTVETIQVRDTTKKDSTTHFKTISHYKPDSLILLAFKEQIYKQSFIKAERKEPYKTTFYFRESNIYTPHIQGLNFNASKDDLIQTNQKKDTITYWISDSATWNMDSLKIRLSYLKTDSLNQSYLVSDTLNLEYHKLKKKDPKKNIKDLPISINLKNQLDLYDSIRISFDQPIKSASSNSIHLYSSKDTVWTAIPVHLIPLDSLGFSFAINNKWNSELSYKLSIDSAAFISKYGLTNNKKTIPFKVKSLEQYSTLIVTLSEFRPNLILEVLDLKDNVIRKAKAKEQGTEFEYLNPGDYHLRLFIDSNQNGKWDPGNYREKKQAEQVHYFNGKISLRANWDVEQEWDDNSLPITRQKPLAETKKPVKDKKTEKKK